MEVYTVEGGVRERQELTEQFSGTWSIGYTFEKANLEVNYTEMSTAYGAANYERRRLYRSTSSTIALVQYPKHSANYEG